MRIIICGACGRIGKELTALCDKGFRSCTCAAKVDLTGGDDCFGSLSEYRGNADVIIDFSSHSAVNELLFEAEKRSLPVVIATTGHTKAEQEIIDRASLEIPIFQSCNMSIGMAHIIRMIFELTKFYPDADIEIIETHHSRKTDVPSGTALLLANEIIKNKKGSYAVVGRSRSQRRSKNEIGIHSVRLGNCAGTHEVIFSSGYETITLKHEALSPILFAMGAIEAAEFILRQAPGLYGMKNISEEYYEG